MLKVDDYRSIREEISGLTVNITSYKLGGLYHCHIDNLEPTSTIARSEAMTEEEAVSEALARARERLAPKFSTR